MDKHGCLGKAYYELNTIELQDISCDGIELSSVKLLETFHHELVHFILYSMGEVELRNNEKFVATFSGLLHQSLATAVYKGEKNDK